MFGDPQTAVLVTGAAFLLGWLLAKAGSAAGRRRRAEERDPRDDRIRSLEAELRIAQSGHAKTREQLEQARRELEDARRGLSDRENTRGEQERLLARLREDLKDSVKKTHELRAELADRAEEIVRHEVRVRDLETELSIAQSSPDLMADSLLNYTEAESGEEAGAAEVRGALR